MDPRYLTAVSLSAVEWSFDKLVTNRVRCIRCSMNAGIRKRRESGHGRSRKPTHASCSLREKARRSGSAVSAYGS